MITICVQSASAGDCRENSRKLTVGDHGTDGGMESLLDEDGGAVGIAVRVARVSNDTFDENGGPIEDGHRADHSSITPMDHMDLATTVEKVRGDVGVVENAYTYPHGNERGGEVVHPPRLPELFVC